MAEVVMTGVVGAHNAEGWEVCLGCGKATTGAYELFCKGCVEPQPAPTGVYTVPSSVGVRTFATGANRDTAEGKPDYDGYLHPLTIKRFGEFMLKHQTLRDGTVRSSSNWTAGMPREVYVKSLMRHVEDVRRHVRGCPEAAVEPFEEALCAAWFNIQGLLLEVLLARDVKAP